MPCTHVRLVIASNVVDVVFRQKRSVDDPGNVRDDLIHPATMADGFTGLCVNHTPFNLWSLTCSALLTPTSRYTFGKGSLACRIPSERVICGEVYVLAPTNEKRQVPTIVK